MGVAPDVAHFMFRQLLAAMEYFQDRGVVHRDIKPENILLDKLGNVKVTDFGLATVFRYKGTTRALNKKCGTPPYVAPEVYAGEL
jgi:serine/threonine-protein kinase Chk1